MNESSTIIQVMFLTSKTRNATVSLSITYFYLSGEYSFLNQHFSISKIPSKLVKSMNSVCL